MSSMYGNMGQLTGPAGKNLRGNATGNIIPKGYEAGQIRQFSPEQMQLFQQLFSHVNPQSYLSKLAGGDESAFQQIEAPQMRQFQELLGQVGSRFSHYEPGAMSARKGSGFQNQINSATSNFAQDLASRRMELQRQALMDLMGLSTSLLGQRPYEQFLVKKHQEPSFFEKLFGATAPAIGGGLGFLLGGPSGGLMGSQAGGSLSRALLG